MIYKIKRTNKFTKQYAKMLKQKEFREEECHIQPDILLEYQKHNKELILLLLGIGSHSDLFK